ncbi:MAG: UDP-N-acetylmuramoyl-L-alanyl-D-glutamate--2,6-diaminopimelate ligase [Gammaproteobacteria bacterium]
MNATYSHCDSPQKELSSLLYGVVGEEDLNGIDVRGSVAGLTLDSRKLNKDDLFLAIPGTHADGRHFVSKAMDAGAKAVLFENKNAPQECRALERQRKAIGVADLRQQISLIAARFFDFPTREMTVVGITGTNGKTTCAYLLAQALNRLGESAAIMGTIQSVCMEVSSHGLEQGRVNAVDFKVAVLTNLSQDHLDYHQTMSSYAAAKQRLFNFRSLDAIVINRDDQFGREILDQHHECKTISYGLEIADVTATDCRITDSGLAFTLIYQDQELQIKSTLLGEINLPNILATVSTLLALDYTPEQIAVVIPDLLPPPGRMEMFRGKQSHPRVVVDYSHTPDSLERALQSLRKSVRGRLWVVFGCGGDRDKGKRGMMGKVAVRLADHVVITNDNPRFEDPHVIAAQVVEGIDENVPASRYEIILERRDAIQHAIQNTAKDDLVLVAGKGHETTQTIGAQKSPFSDRELVREILGGSQ